MAAFTVYGFFNKADSFIVSTYGGKTKITETGADDMP